MLLGPLGPQIIDTTSAPLDQILALLQSILRWEFLPEALVTGLYGSFAVWSLLQKAEPFPLDLIGPPPFDEARWMRIWGWGDFEEDLARDRANWPSQWRENTQVARDAWQEREERRVRSSHTIGKIFLVCLLVLIAEWLWTYQS